MRIYIFIFFILSINIYVQGITLDQVDALKRIDLTERSDEPIKTVDQLPMSLSKAIQIGLNNNFQIKLVQIDEEIAIKNKNFGVARRFPQISFSLNELNRLRIDSSPTSFIDGSFTKNELTAGLDVSWLIFEGFAAKINKQRLDELAKLGNGNAQLVIQNAINSITLAYFNALVENEKLNVYTETLKLSQDKRTNAATLYNFGDIAKLDYLNFQNAYLNDSIGYQQQFISYNRALITLKYLIGYKNDHSVNLTDSLDFITEMPDFMTLQDAMLSNNLDLQNDMISLSLAQHQINLAKSARYPSIEMRSGVSDELATSKFTDEDREQGNVFDYYLSFALKYNIYNGNVNRQRIQVASLEQDRVLMRIEQKKLLFKEQLKKVHEDYVERKNILYTQDRLIINLTQSMKLYKERYESGYSVFIEFRNAQLELLNAKLRRLETLYQLKVAETDILRLVGGTN